MSIRKRAMDVAFSMCNQETAADVVASLLGYVGVADLALREELVLKTAILAEKYAHSMDW